MTASRQIKNALVIGASSGVGRATAQALISLGVDVIGAARGRDALESLAAEFSGRLRTVEADAADPASAEGLLREFKPDVVVLSAGVRPRMATLDKQDWQSFSQAWNVDTQAAFHLVKAALTIPLSRGSSVVIVSSGAAIDGSPLSGGYAGAKRMQWLLVEYAQSISDEKNLGIRFLAVLPHQLIEGTEIGNAAAAAYGASRGISAAELFKRNWDVPLNASKVSDAIVDSVTGDLNGDVTAIEVTGRGVATLT